MKTKLKNTISSKLQFIDSARFMESLLSNLVNNLAERIHKIKCKYSDDNEKCEMRGIKDCECCLEYKKV